MTFLSLYTTPEQLIGKLKDVSANAFDAYIKDRNEQYQIFKSKSKLADLESVTSDVKVITFKELSEELLKSKGDEYTKFFDDKYKDIVSRIYSGNLNYPDATLEFMSSVLDFANYSMPVILVGFAPPYYPSVNSNLLKGKEGIVDKLYDRLSAFMVEKFDQPMEKEYYSMGISDMSYCGMDKTFDYETFKKNTPMWGDCYSFDLSGIEELSIPSVEFGPIGRDCHQWTERVKKHSLFVEIPSATKEFLDFAWNN
jgi:arginine utilization protein RocB